MRRIGQISAIRDWLGLALQVIATAPLVNGSLTQRRVCVSKPFHRTPSGLAMAAACLGIAVIPASASSLLYEQSSNYKNGVASQNDTKPGGLGNFATAYDNFTLGSTSDITSIKWVGVYFNPPIPGTITGFTVSFYADMAGAPGSLLYSTGDVPGNAGESFLQNDNLGNPDYLYALDTSFVASAGTPYWLSIVPDLVNQPQWAWQFSSTGDGTAYHCFMGQPCGSVQSDLAFSLYGGAPVTAPEPGSVILLVTGLVALGPTARRSWLR